MTPGPIVTDRPAHETTDAVALTTLAYLRAVVL
jgi:hypothetical protein